MILNEIVNYLIFRDFIIPLVIIICCLMGCLIIYVYLELQEEIDRLNNDIKVLLKENENKEKVIKAQDNIIKEVRELLSQEWYTVLRKKTIKQVLEILGGENNDK